MEEDSNDDVHHHDPHHETKKVDVRLPGKGNSKSHGARPVHQIISMINWIRTSRLSIKNSLSLDLEKDSNDDVHHHDPHHENNNFTELCSGSEEGSNLRLIHFCINQL